MKKWMKTLAITALSAMLMVSAVGCGQTGKAETIRIVHKNYTEQRLLGEMLSVYLGSLGYQTEVSELGGTMLCFNAIKEDNADMYIEYTGTGYGAILGQTEILSPDETYDYVKSNFEDQYGITWLEPMGFNNTYVLSVTSEMAEKYDLKTTSDLIGISGDMVIGSDPEFASRTDGYNGMLKAYPGLAFKELKTMDQGLTYQALANGDLNVNVSYATDGRIAKFNLVNLQDDKHFFPPYYCAPIMKQSFIDANPEVAEALEKLMGLWTDENMQQYNLLVDEGGDLQQVATQMLTDAGLISGD
jgi:glycine betaine/choline ABC-type transport system substrate-binding protein